MAETVEQSSAGPRRLQRHCSASELMQALEAGKCIGRDDRYSGEDKPRWVWIRDHEYFQVCGWGSSLLKRADALFDAMRYPDRWVIGDQSKLENGNYGDFVPDPIQDADQPELP